LSKNSFFLDNLSFASHLLFTAPAHEDLNTRSFESGKDYRERSTHLAISAAKKARYVGMPARCLRTEIVPMLSAGRKEPPENHTCDQIGTLVRLEKLEPAASESQ
jgi:hypothetical protein